MPDSRCPTAEAKALNRNQIKLGVVFGVSPSCVDVDWTGVDWSGVEWSEVVDWTMKEEERIVYFAI